MIGCTSGSRPSETGGAKFLTKFFNNLFLGISRKNFFIPKKFHMYLQKFLTTFFFSHRPFLCFLWYFSIGGQICSRHRYGGTKILTFQQNHNTTIALSVPEGGPNSIANFDGGYGRICPPPWIRH